MSASDPATPPTPTDDLEDADPGLARERTELAWTRTAISFAAIGAAILKYRPAVGAPIMAFAAVIWPLGYFSRTQTSARTAARRVLIVTVTVTTLAGVGLVIELLGHSSRGFAP